MQIVLSQYSIEVMVIPRKELEGEVVSASCVRMLIETGIETGIQAEIEAEAKKLVPACTWDVLKQK